MKRRQPSNMFNFSSNQERELLNRNGLARLSNTSMGDLSQLESRTCCRSAKIRGQLGEALGATYFEDLLILEIIS